MFLRRLPLNFVLKSAVAGSLVTLTSKKLIMRSYCEADLDSNSASIAAAIAAKRDPFDVIDEDEELEWDSKAENCGFCRMFLESPCRVNFQRWSKCVDRSKNDGGDYISACKTYTEALVGCTNGYSDYFEQLRKEKTAEVAEVDDEESEVEGVAAGNIIATSDAN